MSVALWSGGHRFALCDITSADAPGMLVTVDGVRDWILHLPGVVDPTDAECLARVRAAIGVPDLDVELRSVLGWRPHGHIADEFRCGRVFLVGDAAHTVPPVGAFGLNTGIADAHNLAWKLAAVLAGRAGEGLLDSYAVERRPVAEVTLQQALLRLADPRLHWDSGAVAARAAAGVLNAPIVITGQRYVSGAVLGGGAPLPSTEDVEAVLDGTPGSRVSHRWLSEGVSTLDLIGPRMTLLAPRPVEAPVDVDVHVVPGLDATLLVRPDQIVAWRTTGEVEPGGLTEVLDRVLARTGK